MHFWLQGIERSNCTSPRQSWHTFNQQNKILSGGLKLTGGQIYLWPSCWCESLGSGCFSESSRAPSCLICLMKASISPIYDDIPRKRISTPISEVHARSSVQTYLICNLEAPQICLNVVKKYAARYLFSGILPRSENRTVSFHFASCWWVAPHHSVLWNLHSSVINFTQG